MQATPEASRALLVTASRHVCSGTDTIPDRFLVFSDRFGAAEVPGRKLTDTSPKLRKTTLKSAAKTLKKTTNATCTSCLSQLHSGGSVPPHGRRMWCSNVQAAEYSVS